VTLTLAPPPPELARELEQVRARAQALAAYIRSANAPFPEDFPKADILAVSEEMAELPDGTAQGCLPPLEYADMRLADIRSLHLPAIDPAHAPKGDQHPALTRDEGLDRDLSGLMVAIATARRVANRIAAIEPEESRPSRACPGMPCRVSPKPSPEACASATNFSKHATTSTRLLCQRRNPLIIFAAL
jgi:hypothetical protein